MVARRLVEVFVGALDTDAPTQIRRGRRPGEEVLEAGQRVLEHHASGQGISTSAFVVDQSPTSSKRSSKQMLHVLHVRDEA